MMARRAFAIVVAAMLVLAPAAAATLPPAGPIVLGKAIGTVRLGMTFAAAKKAWPGGTCGTAKFGPYCSFTDPAGRAAFGTRRGKISSISIAALYDARTKNFIDTGPLTAFKTAKGIHIGSTTAAVKRAYPKAKTPKGGGALIVTTRKHKTYFDFFKGVVYSIIVVA